MNRFVYLFAKQFEAAKKKGWDKIYVGVDIHETVLKPTWNTTLSTEFYPDARETLELMSDDPSVVLILWSCSLKELNLMYHEFFDGHDIRFDYINENPDVRSTDYADFDTKLYFNIGLDDKFGFIPKLDWNPLLTYFLSRASFDEQHMDSIHKQILDESDYNS